MAKTLLCLVMSLLSVGQALAEDSVSVYQQYPVAYLQGSVGETTLKFDGFNVNVPTLSYGMGGMISKHFGLEVRLGRSVMRTDYQQSRFAIDHMASAFGTLRFPIWRFIYGQAYAGMSNARILAIDPGGDKTRDSNTSMSYGMDLGIRVIPNWRISLGYTSYIDKSDWKSTAVEGNLLYLF
jgi:opacity protein-like surface antigen